MPQTTLLYDRSMSGRTVPGGAQYHSNTNTIDKYHIVDSLGYGSGVPGDDGGHHVPQGREFRSEQKRTEHQMCNTGKITLHTIVEKPSSLDGSTTVSEEREMGELQPSTQRMGKEGTEHVECGDVVLCRVPGCRTNVVSGSPVNVEDNRKYRVCEVHRTSLFVMIGGLMQRFCDGCKEFHHIEAFQNNAMVCAKYRNEAMVKRSLNSVERNNNRNQVAMATPETPVHTVHSPGVVALRQEESPSESPSPPPPPHESDVVSNKGMGRKRVIASEPVDVAPRKRGRPKKVRTKVQAVAKKKGKAVDVEVTATQVPTVKVIGIDHANSVKCTPCGCGAEFLSQVLKLVEGGNKGNGRTGNQMIPAMIGDGIFVSYSSLMKMLHAVNVSLAVLDEPFSGKQINIDGALAVDPPQYLPQDIDFMLQKTTNRTSALLKMIANQQRNTILRPQPGVMPRPSTQHANNVQSHVLPQQMQSIPMHGYQNHNNSNMNSTIMRQHQDTAWQARPMEGGGHGAPGHRSSSQNVLGELEKLILYGHV
jgi:hypothetical protein